MAEPTIQEQVTQAVKETLENVGFTEETAKTLKEMKEVKRAPIGEKSETKVEFLRPEKFKTFGEQLKAVYLHAAAGQTDNRLITKQVDLQEGVDSLGGFLVQPEFAQGILQRTYETGAVLSRCRKVTIGGNSNSIVLNALDETSRATGSRFGGVQSYWLAEAGTKTHSHPTFRQMRLTLHKTAALYYTTDELLQDVAALESIVSPYFTQEIQFQVENALIRGTGVGQPLGILNSPALISVAAQAGQAAATIVSQNIVNMWTRMWAKSRPNAVWFYNQDIEPQLFLMSLVVGLGGVPTYLPANGLSGQPYGTLMGRPCIPIEYCSTLGTIGDLILADMGEMLVADKGGIATASSTHVQFLTDQTCFRFVYRIDAQPLWAAALTPFQGTNTLSPFVALATRP